jgi:hypothetical protein
MPRDVSKLFPKVAKEYSNQRGAFTKKLLKESFQITPKYKGILKKYLIENKFLSSHFRNKIIQVL